MIDHSSIDIDIVSYVHTHPFDYSANPNIYNPTPVTNEQEFGDWQLSHDYGIPGKIITPDKIVNFHYDASKGTKSAQEVVDGSINRSTACPQ